MKRALDDSENRATELEMNKRALEGDIQRLSMILTDKDTEIQVYQERCESLIRQIQVRTMSFCLSRNHFIDFHRIEMKNVNLYN